MWISAQWEPGLELVDESMLWFRADRSISDVTWVTCRMNIGVSLLQLGRYKEAVEWLEMAKDIRRWVDGKDSFGLAQCYNNLGIAHQHLEQFEQAVAAGREALRLHEINSGGRSRGVAMSLNNLAMTLTKAGMLEEAETAAVRAASLCEFHKELLGPVADTMAEIYEAQGKLQQAVAARTRAIWAIGRWEKPGRLIEVAQKHAIVLERMGRTGDAADCREGVQSVRQRSFYGYAGTSRER